MEEKKNSIDQSIEVIQNMIASHRGWSRMLFSLLLALSITFLMFVAQPLIQKIAFKDNISRLDSENDFINKINKNDSLKYTEYKTLVDKAVKLQQLINEKAKLSYSTKKDISNEGLNIWDYIIYGIFILIFGVISSFYRFHLKEISKQEHYLIGFHRVRVAGNNSKTKYDDEVKISLTRNAFEFNIGKNEKISNPMPGNPSSDIAITLLNKVMDKLEFKEKKKS